MSEFGPSSFTLSGGSSPQSVECSKVLGFYSCLLKHVKDFYRIKLPPGDFLLETWGASGGAQRGNNKSPYRYGKGGLGGYSRGEIPMKTQQTIFGYVGSQGQSYDTASPTIAEGGWNGGGASLSRHGTWAGGTSGGGSSDLCTISSTMNSSSSQTTRTFESYQSRIIVGGGGGGGWSEIISTTNYRISSNGGIGGGEESEGSGYGITESCSSSRCGITDNFGNTESYSYNYVSGSSQTSTGEAKNAQGTTNDAMSGATQGSFGYGGSATKAKANSGGGGGGGWIGGRGGTSGYNPQGTGGAGGTGYVHRKRNELSSLGDSFILSQAITMKGDQSFPTPLNPLQNETGHTGDGFIRITQISTNTRNSIYIKCCQRFFGKSPTIYIFTIPFISNIYFSP